jgi:hypothetical protein
VLRTDGEAVDWSRANNEGVYSVVLPAAGRYVVVSSADGWAPRSEILAFSDPTTHQHIQLAERLTLSGRVTCAGSPVGQALVSVTKPTGESVASVQADGDGHYAMPLPPTGRYILTIVDPQAQWSFSRQIVVIADQSNTVDVDAGAAAANRVLP